MEPRPLDANEIAILLRVAGEFDEPIVHVLAAQVDKASVSGGLVTMLHIEVGPGAEAADLPDGPLDVRLYHKGGVVFVWIADGRLSALEHAWWSDDTPDGMPDAIDLARAP